MSANLIFCLGPIVSHTFERQENKLTISKNMNVTILEEQQSYRKLNKTVI